MRITSEKKVIQKLKEGFKIEQSEQHRRILYYLTNYKDTEITVSKQVIKKLREKGVLDHNYEYSRKINKANTL